MHENYSPSQAVKEINPLKSGLKGHSGQVTLWIYPVIILL